MGGGVKDEWKELDDKGPDVKQGSSVRVRDWAKDEGQGGRHTDKVTDCWSWHFNPV